MATRIILIVPARGGSKGVPRKNIRLAGGRPLIEYSLDSAAGSARTSTCVISTDDDDIAAVGERRGVRVLRRPAALAADDTPMVPVVRHVLEMLEAESGERFDVGVLLQPTAPLRSSEDIDGAIDLLMSSGADSVVSVCRAIDAHPARMYRVEQQRLVPYASEPPARLRQELPLVYHRNGAIYAFRRDVLDSADSLLGHDIRPFVMPEERSLNIDTEFTLRVADLLLSDHTR